MSFITNLAGGLFSRAAGMNQMSCMSGKQFVNLGRSHRSLGTTSSSKTASISDLSLRFRSLVNCGDQAVMSRGLCSQPTAPAATVQQLYTHTRPKQIILLRVFSSTQLVAWTYMGYAINDLYDKRRRARRTVPAADEPLFSRLSRSVGESAVVGALTTCCVGLGLVLVAAAAVLTKQTVKSIQLVGRNRVVFETYGLLTPERFEALVMDCSSMRGRNPKS